MAKYNDVFQKELRLKVKEFLTITEVAVHKDHERQKVDLPFFRIGLLDPYGDEK